MHELRRLEDANTTEANLLDAGDASGTSSISVINLKTGSHLPLPQDWGGEKSFTPRITFALDLDLPLSAIMPHELAKARVLVVDDHYSNRLALETLLEGEYAVDTAGSGQSALKLASNHAYAVILLDVRMPEMDGFETAALLRENPKVHDTAIIFTSAYDQSDAKVAKGFQVGASDYLLSPFDTDFLKLKMRTYVRMYLRIQALSSASQISFSPSNWK